MERYKERRASLLEPCLKELSPEKHKVFKELFRYFWTRGAGVSFDLVLPMCVNLVKWGDIAVESRVFGQHLRRYIIDNKTKIVDYESDGRMRNHPQIQWLYKSTEEFYKIAKENGWYKHS